MINDATSQWHAYLARRAERERLDELRRSCERAQREVRELSVAVRELRRELPDLAALLAALDAAVIEALPELAGRLEALRMPPGSAEARVCGLLAIGMAARDVSRMLGVDASLVERCGARYNDAYRRA